MKRKIKPRHAALCLLLLLVWLTQWLPGLASLYSRSLYPAISYTLSGFSNLFPFALGDLFIFLCLMGVALYPLYARRRKRMGWRRVLAREVEFLLWIYVWFYLAWGLNYAQPDFYQRTGVPYVAYTPERFQDFVDEYIVRLNGSYTPVEWTDRERVCDEIVSGYARLSDSLGVHRPPHSRPRAKTMLFTPLVSMVGVTGSMGPFFCEFTLNGDLLPADYPATYAHELAHLLGVASEAEANFYAYQVCTRSGVPAIRFSGYYFILGHVLGNARSLFSDEEYADLLRRVRPEIIDLARRDQEYWARKYSPVVGAVQNWAYDLYLKGNKVESGRKNYSEVIGLLISYREARP